MSAAFVSNVADFFLCWAASGSASFFFAAAAAALEGGAGCLSKLLAPALSTDHKREMAGVSDDRCVQPFSTGHVRYHVPERATSKAKLYALLNDLSKSQSADMRQQRSSTYPGATATAWPQLTGSICLYRDNTKHAFTCWC